MNRKLLNALFQLAAILLALAFTAAVLMIAGAPPLNAFREIVVGSAGSIGKICDVLVVTAPLLLVTAGLLITFAAGLWNIGIEGQITVGAIFATWVLRYLQDSSMPPMIIIMAGMMAGIAGGALWAILAGMLRTYGGVNEIFGGLGLNYVASALTIWLIFGPWKRPGIGSMSGTEPFPESLWLPLIPGTRLGIWAIMIAIAAIICVAILLRSTSFGLKLKAVGKNDRAAFLMGIPTARTMAIAFAICGGLAGLAGSLQVNAVYHRLIPSISSGYGYLGLLVALLIRFRVVWAIPVTIFFAAINIGSIQLPVALQLDSSLAGVLQGFIVLFVLLVEGARQRIVKPRVGDW